MNWKLLEDHYTHRPVADIATARRVGIVQEKARSLAQTIAAFLPDTPRRARTLETLHDAYEQATAAITEGRSAAGRLRQDQTPGG
jgi:hypothetical protein